MGVVGLNKGRWSWTRGGGAEKEGGVGLKGCRSDHFITGDK